MFNVAIDDYCFGVHRGPLPDLYNTARQHARLSEEFAPFGPDGETCLITARHTSDWPTLVVAQRFQPSSPGFEPGILFVPETRTLFIGAGERLLAYDLDRPSRLWEDTADTGFWCWNRHQDIVVMSAELEFAAWDIRGLKLWTTFVEPPWQYRVDGDHIHLDVMGKMSSFPLLAGPLPRGA
jgi:hypothetical protein